MLLTLITSSFSWWLWECSIQDFRYSLSFLGLFEPWKIRLYNHNVAFLQIIIIYIYYAFLSTTRICWIYSLGVARRAMVIRFFFFFGVYSKTTNLRWNFVFGFFVFATVKREKEKLRGKLASGFDLYNGHEVIIIT